MGWGAIAGAVAAPIVGGIVGNMMGAGDRNKQMGLLKDGLKELQAMGLPPDLSIPLILEKFKEIGIEDPRLEQDVEIAASEVAQLEEDPILRNAQLEALDRMKMMSKVGLGPEERAALNIMRQEGQQDVRSNIDALAAAGRRRGEQQTSGSTLAAQLQSIQSGADRASTEGLGLAGLISQKVKEGAMSSAEIASQMRSQDYQAEMARRQAEDERNRFIASNTIARQRANLDRLNEAQQRRESQAMQVATANTQMSNAERQRQNEAQRQFYLDRLARAQAMSGQAKDLAGAYGDRADRTASMWSGIGSGIGQGISAYGQYKQGQDQLDAYNRRTDAMEDENDWGW